MRAPLPRGSGVRSTSNRHPGGTGGGRGRDLVAAGACQHDQPGEGLRRSGRRKVGHGLGDGADRCRAGPGGHGRRRGRRGHRQQLRFRAVQTTDGVGERARVDRARRPHIHLDQPGERFGSRGNDPWPAGLLRGPLLGALPDRQQRLRTQAGDLAGDRRRVGGVGGRPGGEQHGRAQRDRGGGGAGLPAGVAVGGQHHDGCARVQRGAGRHRERHRRGGREDGRGVGRCAEPRRRDGLPDRFRRRAAGEHRAGRHQRDPHPGPPPDLRRRTSRLPAPRPPASGRANPRVAPTRRP